MMINPFIICSVEERLALQAYADREDWRNQCWVLGATDEQTSTYDEATRALAITTVYPNHVVVEYLRRLALESLARGEGMPMSPQAAIENEDARAIARWLEKK